jgi:hypothetical protein
MKIRPVGAEFFRCGEKDRRTDMTKLLVVFRNFANTPKDEEVTVCTVFPLLKYCVECICSHPVIQYVIPIHPILFTE